MSEAYTGRYFAGRPEEWVEPMEIAERAKVTTQSHDAWNTEEDPVEHPAHYASGGVECIDAIRASMTAEAFSGYCKGNVQKYVWRYERKGGVESLRKAQVYLKWLIENEEKRA